MAKSKLVEPTIEEPIVETPIEETPIEETVAEEVFNPYAQGASSRDFHTAL
jgi:hypothetical protein